MEIQQLSEAADSLEQAILDFPLGAHSTEDCKPIEQKIADVRKSLKALTARRLTLKAIIDSQTATPDPTQQNFQKSLNKLNESSAINLLNKKTLDLSHRNEAVQDILFNNKGTPEMQETLKLTLDKLFNLNEELSVLNETKKELMMKQFQLKLECHHEIYNHQDFLKEQEAKKNQKLEETNPDIIRAKEKINQTLYKINTMKKLITNLIAPNCHKLVDHPELVEMLAKHKQTLFFEQVLESSQNQNNSESENN